MDEKIDDYFYFKDQEDIFAEDNIGRRALPIWKKNILFKWIK